MISDKHLADDIAEVIALGAVEVLVRTTVLVLRDGLVEAVPGQIDLLADLGQVGDAQGSTVLFQQLCERQVVP